LAGTISTKFQVPCVQAMNEYAVLSRNLNKHCGSILAYMHVCWVGVSHKISYRGFNSPGLCSSVNNCNWWVI